MRTAVRRTLLIITMLSSLSIQAETKLAQPWADREFINSHGPFNSVLVIGVPDEPDERNRLETTITTVLKKNGVNTTASLDLMSIDTEVNKENVLSAIAGKNVDSVLLIRVYRIEEVDILQVDNPGTKRSERDFALGLWGDYTNARDYALDAAKKRQRRIVLENSVYDLDSATLVWTVQSYSMDPKNADEVIESLSQVIAKALKKENLI